MAAHDDRRVWSNGLHKCPRCDVEKVPGIEISKIMNTSAANTCRMDKFRKRVCLKTRNYVVDRSKIDETHLINVIRLVDFHGKMRWILVLLSGCTIQRTKVPDEIGPFCRFTRP